MSQASAGRDAVLDVLAETNGPSRPLLLQSNRRHATKLKEEDENFIDERIGALVRPGQDLWESDANNGDSAVSRRVRNLCTLLYRANVSCNERFGETGILVFLFCTILYGMVILFKNNDEIRHNSVYPKPPDPSKAKGKKACFPLTGWQTPSCTTCGENWEIPDCNACKAGHFGPFCNKTCPGANVNSDPNTICSNHGWCDDGVHGTGLCSCDFLWRGSLLYYILNQAPNMCNVLSYEVIIGLILAVCMTPFWSQLSKCSRSKDPRSKYCFDRIWNCARRCHYSRWLTDCFCCCGLFQNNPRAQAAAEQRKEAFGVSPPKYHIFQGMIQGSLILILAAVGTLKGKLTTDRDAEIATLLVCLPAIFVVMMLSRKQSTIYGQSVVKIASRYIGAKIQVDERTADIQKLQGAYYIPEGDVSFTNLLSAGGFGEVWRGTFKRFPGMPVAIKKIFITPENMDLILEKGIFGDKEIKLLMRLNNERVVKFFGAGILGSNGQPFLVSEFMNGGDLRQMLDARVPVWTERVQIALDVADGMAYLHSVGLLHRDLKSLNVLLEKSSNRAKITDFGASRFTKEVRSRSLSNIDTTTSLVESSSKMPALDAAGMDAKTGAVGTLAWMAPEIMRQLRGNTLYGLASDVYSFGVVVYELLTLRAPWDNVDQPYALNTMRLVLSGGRPEVTEEVEAQTLAQPGGDVLLSMMRECWGQEPSERPSFSEISVRIRRDCM